MHIDKWVPYFGILADFLNLNADTDCSNTKPKSFIKSWLLYTLCLKPLHSTILYSCVRVTQDVRMECGPVLPDSLVLEIFLRLPHDAVLRAGLTCRQWLAVSRDEFLWRELFYSYYRIPRLVPRHPGKYLYYLFVSESHLVTAEMFSH